MRPILIAFALCFVSVAGLANSHVALQVLVASHIPAVTNPRPNAPFQKEVVYIKRDGSPNDSDCSATIVSSTTILTAAHCVNVVGGVYRVATAPGVWRELTCRFNPGFGSTPAPDVTLGRRLVQACRSGSDPTGKSYATVLAEYRESAKGRILQDHQMPTDLAACKLVSGTFSGPQATLKRFDQLSGSLEHIGYGCTGYEGGWFNYAKQPTQSRGWTEVVRPHAANAPFLSTHYQQGNGTRSGLCPGDSGGFTGEVIDDRAFISLINSGSDAVKKVHPPEAPDCKFRLEDNSVGTSVLVNLYSQESDAFLRQLETEGFTFNGRTVTAPNPGATPVPPSFISNQEPRPFFQRAKGRHGGPVEFHPSGDDVTRGTVVLKNAAGQVIERLEYNGDPRLGLVPVRPLVAIQNGEPRPKTTAPVNPLPQQPPPPVNNGIANAWRAAGQQVAQDGTPIIRIGVPHPPLTSGQVYLISGQRWRYVGGRFVRA